MPPPKERIPLSDVPPKHTDSVDAVLLPLILFLIFTPFYDSIGMPAVKKIIFLMDWQRFSEMLAIPLVLVMLCILVWPARRNFYRLPAVQALGWPFFFAIGALSSIFALHPRFAWIEWSWILICFMATVLLSLQAIRDFRSVTTIVRFWVLSVLTSYTSLYYIRNSDYLFGPEPLSGPLIFGFNNVRVFSDYQTVILCLLPWALRGVSSASIRGGAWLLAGCYAALAFVVGSRSMIFGQILAAVVVVLMLGWRSAVPYLFGQMKLWLVASVTYGLLFVLFPLLFGDGAQVTMRLQLRSDSSGRIALWESAWQMARMHPWLGVGPMNFSAIPNSIAASPHNHILQVMAEYGFVAAALFVFLVGHWLLGVRRGIRGLLPEMQLSDRNFTVSVLAAMLAMLAQSFVSPVFNNPHSQVLLVLLGGVLGCYVCWPVNQKRFSIRRPAFVAISFTALSIFLATCLPWAAHVGDRNACYLSSTETPTLHLAPRFWQQGWLYMPCEPVI